MRSFTVSTFSQGWWLTKCGWVKNPDKLSGASSNENLKGGKVRAIRKAKRLANLAGEAFLIEWSIVDGKRFGKEIYFNKLEEQKP